MVGVLLNALALVTGGQSAARCACKEAVLNSLCLVEVIHVLNDNPPLSVHISGSNRSGVDHVTGADVAFTSDPVPSVVELSSVG